MQFRLFDELEPDEQSLTNLDIDVLTLPFRGVPEFDEARREILENGPGDPRRRGTLETEARSSQSRLSTLLQNGVKRYHDRGINPRGDENTDASHTGQSQRPDFGYINVEEEAHSSEGEGSQEGGSTRREEGVSESSYGLESSGQAWKLL
jgi:hypothetical protein